MKLNFIISLIVFAKSTLEIISVIMGVWVLSICVYNWRRINIDYKKGQTPQTYIGLGGLTLLFFSFVNLSV